MRVRLPHPALSLLDNKNTCHPHILHATMYLSKREEEKGSFKDGRHRQGAFLALQGNCSGA